MKKQLFMLLFWAIYNQSATAQIIYPPENTNGDRVVEMFDISKLPFFPGGESALMQFIRDSMQYPPLAKQYKAFGTVVLDFIVEHDGSFSNITVFKDFAGFGCADEAIRLLTIMPCWGPGEANGYPIRTWYRLPFRFSYVRWLASRQ